MYDNVKRFNRNTKSKWLKDVNLARLRKKPVITGLMSQLKQYFMNTTLHGLRFIVDDSTHWLQK